MMKTGIGRLEAIVVDVSDLATAETFWSAVTGYTFGPSFQSNFRRAAVAPGISLVLQQVPEKKKLFKNRLHLDIGVSDIGHALEQVEALGGKLVQRVTNEVGSLTVCADPDGNEFCLVTP